VAGAQGGSAGLRRIKGKWGRAERLQSYRTPLGMLLDDVRADSSKVQALCTCTLCTESGTNAEKGGSLLDLYEELLGDISEQTLCLEGTSEPL
jgi:hypothetical protein